MEQSTSQPSFDLGQRIMESAKSLACSTFSGVVGIEAELREPMNVLGAKAVTAPVSPGRISEEASTSRRKAGVQRTTAGFRSRRASQQHRDEALEDWAAQKPILDSSYLPKTQEELSESVNPSSQRRYYDTSRNSQATTDEDIFPFQSSTPTISQPDLERSWQKSQSAAAERLSQLEGHISGTLALRTRSQTFVEPYGGLDYQDQRQLHRDCRLNDIPDLLEVITPFSHARLDHAFTTTAAKKAEPTHQIAPLLQSALHPQPGSSPATRWLTCLQSSCHDLLVRQNAHLPLSIHQRGCIHTGCGYVSQDLDSWLTHCASVHSHASTAESVIKEDESCPHCSGRGRGIISTDFRLVVEGRCCSAIAA